MAIEKGAIPITGFIAPQNSLDEYPTHKDKYGQGGLHTVDSYADLLVITTDRRKEGMIAHVKDAKTTYQLIGGITNDKWVRVYNYDDDNNLSFDIYCPNDYVLTGNALDVAQPSPVLIDLRVDLITIKTAPYVIEGQPNSLMPEAVFLGTKPNGFLFNRDGKITFEPAIPADELSLAENHLYIGNSSGLAEAKPYIEERNLPRLYNAEYAPDLFAGQVWRGTATGEVETSNSLSIVEADLLYLNSSLRTMHFVQNSRNIFSSTFLGSQFMTDIAGLTGGVIKVEPLTGLFQLAVAKVDYGTVSGAGVISTIGNIAIWADVTQTTITDSGFSIPDLEELVTEAEVAAAASAASAASSGISAGTATTAAATATTAAATATTEAAAAVTSAATATTAAEGALVSAETAVTAAELATTSATTATGAATEATTAAATATAAATESTASATAATASATAAAGSATGAAASATGATAAATEATGAAATATAAASEATGAAATATGAAGAAGVSATAAAFSAIGASASSSSASSSAADASLSASEAATSALEAATSASASNSSAIAAAATLSTILATGLNSLPNHGNIDFAGYKGINLADPTNPQDAVTKSYVDAIASGMSFHNTVIAATTANLTASYSNGTAGVGATLTNTGVFAAFSTDDITPSLNSRILVKNQSATAQNGIYILTTVGNGSTAWVLTRADDYNAPPEVAAGDIVPVEDGTVNGKTSWLETATVTTIGTDPILFTQFSYAPTSFLQVTSNLSDLNDATAARSNLGLTAVSTQTLTEHSILVGGAANTIVSTALTNGQILIGSTAAEPVATTPSNGTNISWAVGAGTLTANLSGQVAVANGGTGLSSTTAYGVMCGGITGTGNLQNAGAGVLGQVLTSAGDAALPTWQTPTTGTITSITAGTGLSGGTITGSGTISLANTAVTAGSYTLGNFTVDAQGRLTAASSTSTANYGLLTTNGSGVASIGSRFYESNSPNYNLFIGNGTGSVTALGSRNLATGTATFTAITTGSSNTIYGIGAGAGISTGSNNTAIGQLALSGAEGSRNTAVGSSAGFSQLIYNDCILLGYAADTSVNNLTNVIVLANNTTAATSNTMILGNTSITTCKIANTLYPTTTTVNRILFSTANNTIGEINTDVNGVLITSAGSVPSIASTLPSAVQTNITSLGTITAGIWTGTIISPTYGGTGINNGASTITLGGSLTTSGAFATTLTVTGATNVTLPTTGTLVNTDVTTLSSLASVGTISTGTWNGTIISPTYGGTGINNGAKTITLGGNLTTSGAFATTLTVTGTTNVTLPTTGTLVNTAVTTLSSLVSIGTITTGTWNGTTIAVLNGGTGATTATAARTNLAAAPNAATYIVQTANGELSGEQVLGSLATGILKNTTTTGVLSIATAGTDYYSLNNPTRLIDSAATTFNVFVGQSAGNLTLTSTTATGMGYRALTALTSGNGTAYGSNSLKAITTAILNAGFGKNTLFSNTSGFANLAVGELSMQGNVTGSQNTAGGTNSLVAMTSGDNNTVFGFSAGSTQLSYTQCTFIGASADANVNSLSNAIGLGYNVIVSASNTMILGNSSITSCKIANTTYPTTTTANQILWSNAANNITGLTTANNSVLVTNGSGVPSIGSTLPSAVQTNITSLGTVTAGVWNGTTIAVAKGGTGLTSTTANQILYSSATNTIAGLTTGNDKILITNSSGVPAWGNAMAGNFSIGTTDITTAKVSIAGGATDGSGDSLTLALTAPAGNGCKFTLAPFSGVTATFNMRVDGVLYITNGYTMTLDSTKFAISGSVGQKSTGTVWANPSDARIKEIQREYTKGLDEALRMRPIVYKLNALSGVPPEEMVKENVGIIAQEIEGFLPECITIDNSNKKVPNMRIYDATAVTYVLINAVKELNAKIINLQQQIGNL